MRLRLILGLTLNHVAHDERHRRLSGLLSAHWNVGTVTRRLWRVRSARARRARRSANQKVITCKRQLEGAIRGYLGVNGLAAGLNSLALGFSFEFFSVLVTLARLSCGGDIDCCGSATCCCCLGGSGGGAASACAGASLKSCENLWNSLTASSLCLAPPTGGPWCCWGGAKLAFLGGRICGGICFSSPFICCLAWCGGPCRTIGGGGLKGGVSGGGPWFTMC